MKVDGERLAHNIQAMIDFNKARGWNPALVDSAKSIVIEGAELLEHFQWDESDKDIPTISKQKDWAKVAKEVGDVFWYWITFCNKAGIDPNEAIEITIAHNEEKYPAEKFNGQHNEDFYRQQKAKYREGEK